MFCFTPISVATPLVRIPLFFSCISISVRVQKSKVDTLDPKSHAMTVDLVTILMEAVSRFGSDPQVCDLHEREFLTTSVLLVCIRLEVKVFINCALAFRFYSLANELTFFGKKEKNTHASDERHCSVP